MIFKKLKLWGKNKKTTETSETQKPSQQSEQILPIQNHAVDKGINDTNKKATKILAQNITPEKQVEYHEIIKGLGIKIKDIETITELKLWYKEIEDIEFIKLFSNLKELTLNGNQITDITPLKNLSNLQDLCLENNQITDITPLKNLSDLKKLWLFNNQITNITPLKNLSNLQWLYLNNNQITDITPLKNLSNLRDLYLENNQITDITPLKNLSNLRDLYLENNQITDINTFKKIIQNENISLKFNLSRDELISFFTKIEELEKIPEFIEPLKKWQNTTLVINQPIQLNNFIIKQHLILQTPLPEFVKTETEFQLLKSQISPQLLNEANSITNTVSNLYKTKIKELQQQLQSRTISQQQANIEFKNLINYKIELQDKLKAIFSQDLIDAIQNQDKENDRISFFTA